MKYEKSLLILLEVDNPFSVFAKTETTPAPAAIFKEELEFLNWGLIPSWKWGLEMMIILTKVGLELILDFEVVVINLPLYLNVNKDDADLQVHL